MPHVDSTDPVLDGEDRGFPATAAGHRASQIGDMGWRLHEHFETPIAVLRNDALRHNAALMRDWAAREGAELWPHAKTTMSPQLVALQLQYGATGATVATAAQARLLLKWGTPGVFVANELVVRDPAADLARRAADGGQELLCYVDSVDGIAALNDAGSLAGIPINVVLERGAPGGRTGYRTDEQREALLRALAGSPQVRLVGVSGYEGSYAAARTDDANAAALEFLEGLADLLDDLTSRGAIDSDTPLLSAGGSMHFDVVAQAAQRARHPHRLLVRSGCALVHDHGMFARETPLPDSAETPGLRGALTVWGTVLSRPEPTRAYLDIGRRDVGFDQGLPVALSRRAREGGPAVPVVGTTLQLNDQHLHLEVAAESDIRVGDRIEFGISHPCTTLDKWRALALLGDDDAVIAAVTTRF